MGIQARAVCASAYLFVVVVGAFAPTVYAANCSRIGMSKTVSPDGRWIARTYGKLCDLGIESSAAVIVDLMNASLHGIPVPILSVDMPSDRTDWPRPNWTSSKALSIKLPASAAIALQMASYQGIRIGLIFCPGAPADREAWSSYRVAYRKWIEDTSAWIQAEKQDPRAAGQKPVQPKPPNSGRVKACGR
jgi:hypothetical protein